MQVADMQDLCKTHLSCCVTSALCRSGMKNRLCCHSLEFDLFYTARSGYLWRQAVFRASCSACKLLKQRSTQAIYELRKLMHV